MNVLKVLWRLGRSSLWVMLLQNIKLQTPCSLNFVVERNLLEKIQRWATRLSSTKRSCPSWLEIRDELMDAFKTLIGHLNVEHNVILLSPTHPVYSYKVLPSPNCRRIIVVIVQLEWQFFKTRFSASVVPLHHFL